ncbi:GNAT family N-acetyltransferase, partial [Acinetobacter baumannii]
NNGRLHSEITLNQVVQRYVVYKTL